MAQTPKTIQKYENAKLLFSKFVKPEKEFQPGRDIKLYNSLIKLKPFEFWLDLELGFKLNSLAFLISKDGQAKIKEIENRSIQQKFIDKNRAGIKLVEEHKFVEEVKEKDGPNYELDNTPPKVYKNRNSLIDFIGRK